MSTPGHSSVIGERLFTKPGARKYRCSPPDPVITAGVSASGPYNFLRACQLSPPPLFLSMSTTARPEASYPVTIPILASGQAVHHLSITPGSHEASLRHLFSRGCLPTLSHRDPMWHEHPTPVGECKGITGHPRAA